MKQVFIIFFFSVLLFSCTDKKNNNIEKNNQDVFNEKLINTSYKSRYNNNTVDKLFESYLETNKVFKDELNNYYKLNKKIREDKKPFKEFIYNNDNYYEVANNMAKSISDSILSGQIIQILDKSKKEYLKNSKNINDIDSTLANKIKLNNDLISTLKIIHSLSILEKYQTNSDLDFNILIEDEKVLNKFKDSFNKKVEKEFSNQK